MGTICNIRAIVYMHVECVCEEREHKIAAINTILSLINIDREYRRDLYYENDEGVGR